MQRPIRSFVLREGRLTPGQLRALEQLWPRYGLECTPDVILEPARLFNGRPVQMEIGFGTGAALIAMAQAHPERGFLGVEVHRPGIGRLLLELARTELKNVRVLHRDAMEVLALLPPACLEAVHVLFPDPWPKTRHHKRRIIRPAFIHALARVLIENGWVQIATDWAEYATWIMTQFAANPLFIHAVLPEHLSSFIARPMTHFEQRGRRLGYSIQTLYFYRNGTLL